MPVGDNQCDGGKQKHHNGSASANAYRVDDAHDGIYVFGQAGDDVTCSELHDVWNWCLQRSGHAGTAEINAHHAGF